MIRALLIARYKTLTKEHLVVLKKAIFLEKNITIARKMDSHTKNVVSNTPKTARKMIYEELSDGLLDAIVEKLTVDMGESLSGWAGRSADDTKYQMEKELARRRSTDMEEELEALKQAQEALVFENKKLKKNLANYQQVVGSLKENVQDVNLSNARLLYTNRTLGNTSLNERQKSNVVESIRKADSVEEAKVIFETLQSAVGSSKRKPESLREAIKRPSISVPSRKNKSSQRDTIVRERFQRLAGISKTDT